MKMKIKAMDFDDKVFVAKGEEGKKKLLLRLDRSDEMNYLILKKMMK